MSDTTATSETATKMLTVPELDSGARESLRREILRLADSKRILGLRHSDWLLGAPSIEAGIAASAMAQDEWGHARLLYAMLKDFGEDPLPIEHERKREAYASMSCLDESIEDWAEWVATVVVVDGALSTLLEGLAEGGYETAQSRIPKMLAEEGFHADLGRAWIGRLAQGTEEARSRISEAVIRMLPIAARFVAPHDEIDDRLQAAGLRASDAEMAERFRVRMVAALDTLMEESEVEQHLRTDAPSAWDPVRGRAGGSPAEEAVTRARGDLNRDLFVE